MDLALSALMLPEEVGGVEVPGMLDTLAGPLRISAGPGVHVVVELAGGGVQLHLIVGGVLIQLRVHIVGDGGGGHTGVFHGGSSGGGCADGHVGGAGLPQLLELLHRQNGQGIKVQRSVERLVSRIMAALPTEMLLLWAWDSEPRR